MDSKKEKKFLCELERLIDNYSNIHCGEDYGDYGQFTCMGGDCLCNDCKEKAEEELKKLIEFLDNSDINDNRRDGIKKNLGLFID